MPIDMPPDTTYAQPDTAVVRTAEEMGIYDQDRDFLLRETGHSGIVYTTLMADFVEQVYPGSEYTSNLEKGAVVSVDLVSPNAILNDLISFNEKNIANGTFSDIDAEDAKRELAFLRDMQREYRGFEPSEKYLEDMGGLQTALNSYVSAPDSSGTVLPDKMLDFWKTAERGAIYGVIEKQANGETNYRLIHADNVVQWILDNYANQAPHIAEITGSIDDRVMNSENYSFVRRVGDDDGDAISVKAGSEFYQNVAEAGLRVDYLGIDGENLVILRISWLS